MGVHILTLGIPDIPTAYEVARSIDTLGTRSVVMYSNRDYNQAELWAFVAYCAGLMQGVELSNILD